MGSTTTLDERERERRENRGNIGQIERNLKTRGRWTEDRVEAGSRKRERAQQLRMERKKLEGK